MSAPPCKYTEAPCQYPLNPNDPFALHPAAVKHIGGRNRNGGPTLADKLKFQQDKICQAEQNDLMLKQAQCAQPPCDPCPPPPRAAPPAGAPCPPPPVNWRQRVPFAPPLYLLTNAIKPASHELPDPYSSYTRKVPYPPLCGRQLPPSSCKYADKACIQDTLIKPLCKSVNQPMPTVWDPLCASPVGRNVTCNNRAGDGRGSSCTLCGGPTPCGCASGCGDRPGACPALPQQCPSPSSGPCPATPGPAATPGWISMAPSGLNCPASSGPSPTIFRPSAAPTRPCPAPTGTSPTIFRPSTAPCSPPAPVPAACGGHRVPQCPEPCPTTGNVCCSKPFEPCSLPRNVCPTPYEPCPKQCDPHCCRLVPKCGLLPGCSTGKPKPFECCPAGQASGCAPGCSQPCTLLNYNQCCSKPNGGHPYGGKPNCNQSSGEPNFSKSGCCEPNFSRSCCESTFSQRSYSESDHNFNSGRVLVVAAGENMTSNNCMGAVCRPPNAAACAANQFAGECPYVMSYSTFGFPAQYRSVEPYWIQNKEPLPERTDFCQVKVAVRQNLRARHDPCRFLWHRQQIEKLRECGAIAIGPQYITDDKGNLHVCN